VPTAAVAGTAAAAAIVACEGDAPGADSAGDTPGDSGVLACTTAKAYSSSSNNKAVAVTLV
jgi:hypothetical protein